MYVCRRSAPQATVGERTYGTYFMPHDGLLEGLSTVTNPSWPAVNLVHDWCGEWRDMERP